MSGTPRLALPFLSAGQAQKETTLNESLQTLDLLVASAAEQEPLAEPPSAAALGACYLTADAPVGAWAGKPQSVAGYTSGGWRFVTPLEGMVVYVKSIAQFACFRQGSWEMGVLRGASLIVGSKQVVGSRAAPISAPTGGSTVDVEARAAIQDVLSALRQHGLIEA
jgi:Protein of unknown function (DUF2793)